MTNQQSLDDLSHITFGDDGEFHIASDYGLTPSLALLDFYNLLDPNHHNYLETGFLPPALSFETATGRDSILFSGFIIFTLIVLICSPTMMNDPDLVSALYIGVPLVGVFLHSVYRYEKMRRAFSPSESRLISGRFVAVKGSFTNEHKIAYRFESPISGEEINGRQGVLRDDPFPPAGSPVLVLYVNDNLHRVL